MKIDNSVIESIYAGFLGKVIGVVLGSPIEGMWYNRIKNTYGEINSYLFDYDFYASDDDINGPVFFLRGLEDGKHGRNMTSQDVANALLNYAPYEHGFFWWGGYGMSTEHTAYQNLMSGVKAPDSGSIKLNGATVAEQIGGQIFIDTWGLVTPGNPDLACKLAKNAASVTHDGNGVYGGIFIACCISYAFVEKDVRKIIEKGLSYIPKDCEYAKLVNAVIDFYDNHNDDWRECYKYLRENWGYSKYLGNCHIIPNAGVIILSLLYGEGDYSKSICICNMCGWDTDCNAGNVGAIMGTIVGLDGIDKKWIEPINDLFVSSSCVGSLNINDIPNEVLYISKMAAELQNETLPEPYFDLLEKRYLAFFELPKSTSAIFVLRNNGEKVNFLNVKPEAGKAKSKKRYKLENTCDCSKIGNRSLRIRINRPKDGEKVYVFKRTYFHPSDFSDSRYDPQFSPIVYPGQVLHGSTYLPNDIYEAKVSLFYYDERHSYIGHSECVSLKKGEWNDLIFEIPKIEAGLIYSVGFCFDINNPQGLKKDFVCNIDDLYVTGNANYTIDFSKEKNERWNYKHIDVSQFSNVRGLFYLEDNCLNISSSEFACAITGGYDWTDYSCSFEIIPVIGKNHFVNVRLQGAMRSYAVGFKGNEFCILKNEYGYKTLVSQKYKFDCDKEYKISVKVKGNKIIGKVNNDLILEYVDENNPYLNGCIGISNMNGSHTKVEKIKVK